MKKSSIWSRKIKLMNKLLPTLDVMKERYPDIIRTTVCMFCKREEKTFVHLITCEALETNWENIICISLLKTGEKIGKLGKSMHPVLYTDNVRGFSWDNAVRVPCSLSASDIMSVVIGCHADMSANFRNDPEHFLCPGQSNFFFKMKNVFKCFCLQYIYKNILFCFFIKKTTKSLFKLF